MAHDVFISHSSKDKAVADAVCARLEKDGARCWIAPRDIRPGAQWAEAVADAIVDSRVFVLVFSQDSNRSEDCFREISRAAKQGIPVVALRIDDEDPAARMGYYLEPVHWLDATGAPLAKRIGDLADTVGLLLGDLQAVESRATTSAREDVAKKTTGHARLRGKRLALVVAVAVLVVAVAVAVPLAVGGSSGGGAVPEKVIDANGVWDIDADINGMTGAEDLWWEHASQDERYLVPRNGAQVAVIYGTTFDALGLGEVESAIYSDDPLAAQDNESAVSVGSVLAVYTSDGNHAKILVTRFESSGYSSGGKDRIVLQYFLYE